MKMGKGNNKKEWILNNLEIRTIPNDDGSQQSVINGYAAVYNSESDLLYGFFREIIRPGAFDNSLKNDVRCLWNHNASYVLGRSTAGTLEIKSDAKGLYFEVTPPNAQWADDLCESIRRGDINQMSFGFTVNEDNWESLEDGTELRELLDVNLFEVSVVTFPAYQATSAGMRSIDQEQDEEIKKRYEERNKPKESSEPEKRYSDYLKMIKALDFRADEAISLDPDDDEDDNPPKEDEKKSKRNRKESVDDADGGEPLDPGSEADDPDNEDSTDDDEGDENSDDEKRGMDGSADEMNPEDDFVCCDDCGTVQNQVCDVCGCCDDCCIC